jgi:hypothetical protein
MRKVFLIGLVVVLVLGVVAGCGSKPAEDVGAVKLGLGIITGISRSRDMAGETMAQAQVDTTIAAVTFDKDGRIVHVQIDIAQTRVLFDADMQVTNDGSAVIQTKKEQGDAYNMKRASGIGKEWHEQVAALEAWMIGKTIEEVKALPMTEGFVPSGEELTSSVTITVKPFLNVLEKSLATAVE